MPVILPFRPSLDSYQFRAILSSSEYKFAVRWNRFEQAFFFDVREVTDTPILYGVKVVLGTYLGRLSTHPLFRSGFMMARPVGADRRRPGFDDMGIRVLVWYYTNAETVVFLTEGFTGNVAPS